MHKLMSVKDAAELLDLAEITIYKLISSKGIPYVKIGRSVLFEQEKLNAWIEEKSVKPIT